MLIDVIRDLIPIMDEEGGAGVSCQMFEDQAAVAVGVFSARAGEQGTQGVTKRSRSH